MSFESSRRARIIIVTSFLYRFYAVFTMDIVYKLGFLLQWEPCLLISYGVRYFSSYGSLFRVIVRVLCIVIAFLHLCIVIKEWKSPINIFKVGLRYNNCTLITFVFPQKYIIMKNGIYNVFQCLDFYLVDIYCNLLQSKITLYCIFAMHF